MQFNEILRSRQATLCVCVIRDTNEKNVHSLFKNILSRYFGYGGTSINDASKGHRHIWNTYQEEYLLIQVLVRWSYHRFSYKPLVPSTDDFNDLSVKAWWYFLLTQLTKGNSVVWHSSLLPEYTMLYLVYQNQQKSWTVIGGRLWYMHFESFTKTRTKKSDLTVKKVPIFS